MKILWMSDSPTMPTGYGNATRYVCGILADCGHQVSILGWQTINQVRWRNCTLYPFLFRTIITSGTAPQAEETSPALFDASSSDPIPSQQESKNGLLPPPTQYLCNENFDVDALLEYLHRLRPDVFVMLSDVSWVASCDYQRLADFMRSAGIVWALCYSIGMEPGNGRLPQEWIDVLRMVDLPITMSRFDTEVSQASGVRSAYIPLGVNTKVFCPPESKEQAKHTLGYDGRFVVLSDARNQPRKQLPRTLEIFRRFAKDRDDVLLHLHCDPDDPAARMPEYCYDLRAAITALDLTSKVRFTPGMSIGTGLLMAKLAKIYQAADVHLLASYGEGFGLPTLQAASTGVVPMASDYSASRELVGDHGEAIRVEHFSPDAGGFRCAFIDLDDAVSRLERLYQDRQRLAAKAELARRFAQAYDWPRILPQWQDLLQREVPQRQGHRLLCGRW
jgi:glycosyltransferase involved in cell wall biosynthesis